MRNNQVSINIERFSDKEKLGVEDISISVYADSNNIYEALAAAYFEVLQQIQTEGNINLPSFGRRESYPSNSAVFRFLFEEFLKQNNQEDKWLDFKKNLISPMNQFLEAEGLEKEYEAFRKKEKENE